MNGLIISGVVLVGIVVAATAIECVYFYRRTMKRNKAKKERTIKMSGTDWSRHMLFIEERKKYMLAQPHNDVFIKTKDGLKLHATYFPNVDEKKVVICFHGYTSEGMKDYIALSHYYLKNGYSVLLVDERAHGQSEGEYIGFGCLDRIDALCWIDFIIDKCEEDVQILLHGISMGGATVLMTSSLKLPNQVKGIISDCAFTSPKYVFTHVLHSMYHLPAFPVIQFADFVNKKRAGYGMDECNAAKEVRKAKVPILMIHGDSDNFVPCSMCDEIYKNCASPKKKLIIKDASHAESYYVDTVAYEKALNDFIGEFVKDNN